MKNSLKYFFIAFLFLANSCSKDDNNENLSGNSSTIKTSITGRILDQNGTAISGATVVAAGPVPDGTVVQLKDKDGNVIATAATTNGNYTFNQANLPLEAKLNWNSRAYIGKWLTIDSLPGTNDCYAIISIGKICLVKCIISIGSSCSCDYVSVFIF